MLIARLGTADHMKTSAGVKPPDDVGHADKALVALVRSQCSKDRDVAPTRIKSKTGLRNRDVAYRLESVHIDRVPDCLRAYGLIRADLVRNKFTHEMTGRDYQPRLPTKGPAQSIRFLKRMVNMADPSNPRQAQADRRHTVGPWVVGMQQSYSVPQCLQSQSSRPGWKRPASPTVGPEIKDERGNIQKT